MVGMVRHTMERSFQGKCLGNFEVPNEQKGNTLVPSMHGLSALAVATVAAQEAERERALGKQRAAAKQRRGGPLGRIYERILMAADEKKFSLTYLFARYDKARPARQARRVP
jgi:hypothetical protein